MHARGVRSFDPLPRLVFDLSLSRRNDSFPWPRLGTAGVFRYLNLAHRLSCTGALSRRGDARARAQRTISSTPPDRPLDFTNLAVRVSDRRGGLPHALSLVPTELAFH